MVREHVLMSTDEDPRLPLAGVCGYFTKRQDVLDVVAKPIRLAPVQADEL